MQLTAPNTPTRILLVFESAATIEFNVAGVPAGARAAHALATLARTDGLARCTLAAKPGWAPSKYLIAECERLAGDFRIEFSTAYSADDGFIASGEAFVASLAQRHGAWQRADVLIALADARVRGPVTRTPQREGASLKHLRRAGRDIVAATGKRGDGIVSRLLNRPISQAISRQLLKVPGIVPSRASAGTALLGLAMTLCLIFGGSAGLISGALLFQAASIFDGVDGEMARATYRTSEKGAALDSAIDACTNLAFILGVTINVAWAGDATGAAAGSLSLVTLAAGLILIGMRSRAGGEALNFDVIKTQLRSGGKRSILLECLIYLTMRDFYAAACALLIVAGLTHFVLLAFASVSIGWFCVTAVVLALTTRRRRTITVLRPAPLHTSMHDNALWSRSSVRSH